MNPILDQGKLNSCTENALASTINILLDVAGLPSYNISRLQSYYDTREMMGTTSYDSGSVTIYTLEAAKNIGLARETSWENKSSNVYVKPSDEVYAEAGQNKITGWKNIAENKETAKEMVIDSLDNGIPVMLSFNARINLLGGNYLMKGIGSTEVDNSQIVGGHCVVIVGVDSVGYIIQNSYSFLWGNNGFYRIPFTQFEQNPSDLKAIYALEGFGTNDFSDLAERVNIKEAYRAILGRDADPEGLNFWDAQNVSTSVLANALLNSWKGQVIYENQSNEEFVNNMYHYILERDSDAGGLEFYTNALDNGTSRGEIAACLLDSAENEAQGVILVGVPKYEI